MKIAIINTTRKKYGGNIYERLLKECLSDNFDVKLLSVGVSHNNILKYFEAPLVLYRIYKTSKLKEYDCIIRNFESSLFTNKKIRNIILIHHIDRTGNNIIIRFLFNILDRLILNNIKRSNAEIVVVSNYWYNYLKENGFKNKIYKVYNAFDINEFNFSDNDIEDFKNKFRLHDKPVIYIGNAQKKKGVVECYNLLKDLDVYLVTSGTASVNLPIRNLDLDRKEYLLLLKSASVVLTMSKFKEGWCRTAHEAMLCKTPVIGSGLGGMEELLLGGKQIMSDFGELRSKVIDLLNNAEKRKRIGEDGYNFAKKFTLNNFKNEWIKVINNNKN